MSVINEQKQRAKRLERAIVKRLDVRQGRRASATLENGSIKNGRIVSPDGMDMSHRFQVTETPSPRKRRYIRNHSAIGQFSAENGGYVWGLFKSCVTMEAQWADAGLTQSDFARLMFIGTYVNYEGILRHPNGRLITKESLRELIGTHRTKFDDFYRKLTAAAIIKESDGMIYISSDVFHRGAIARGPYTDRTRVYIDTIRELYGKHGKGRSVRQLGIIYSVIPFMHRSLNIICYNPTEPDDENIHPISLEKLALILGYQNTVKFKQALRAIEIEKQPVFAFVEDPNDSRKRRIIVNPRVVFAGDYEGLTACRAIAVLFN